MTNISLGDFEVAVLLSVARLQEDAYGLEVRRDVSAAQKRDYSVGAIYTTLSRLQDKGFVQSWTTEPLPVRGGRSRRHFRVTAAGKKALGDARKRASRLWGGLDLELGST